MRFFGTKKHKLKIKNSIKKANIKNLKDKGFSDEEIEKFLDEIVIYKWRIFTESSFNRYLKVIKRFCKYLAAKFQTSHLTMFEAEKYIQEYIDVREARGLSADTLNTDLSYPPNNPPFPKAKYPRVQNSGIYFTVICRSSV